MFLAACQHVRAPSKNTCHPLRCHDSSLVCLPLTRQQKSLPWRQSKQGFFYYESILALGSLHCTEKTRLVGLHHIYVSGRKFWVAPMPNHTSSQAKTEPTTLN
jgi:hypothetical protein